MTMSELTRHCTCAKDKEITCIVHPTTHSLKEYISYLEEQLELEISEGAMRTEDWNELDIWLDDFETDELLPYKELISEFEKAHGKQIRWVNNES
jgi:hypothetical protein